MQNDSIVPALSSGKDTLLMTRVKMYIFVLAALLSAVGAEPLDVHRTK